MTSFVHIDYPEQHPGVARAEAVLDAAARLRQQFDGARGIAALLLGAIVSALLVLADRLVDSWAGGHLLVAWVVLWAVAVAALALFAAPVRRLAGAMVTRLDAWSARVAQRRADARLWATAQTDPRVMADLEAAIARSDVPAPRVAAAYRASRRVSLRQLVLEVYREAQQVRADAELLRAAAQDPRMAGELRAAADRAEDSTPPVPAITRLLQRAERSTASLVASEQALAARGGYRRYL